MDHLQQERLLSVWPETGQFLNLSRAQTYARVKADEIPNIRIGRSVRVPLRALLAYVQRNTRGGEEAR